MTLYQCRFLTDENIDAAVVDFLRSEGLDVFDIKEQQLFRLSDEEIMEMASVENRIIVTQDSDFGALIFRDAANRTGLIYLRPGHHKPEFHVQTVRELLKQTIDLSPPFVIVAENTGNVVRLRIRLFTNR